MHLNDTGQRCKTSNSTSALCVREYRINLLLEIISSRQRLNKLSLILSKSVFPVF